METRANFVLIGAFTLAAVIGAFAVPHVDRRLRDGQRPHRHYQVVFNGSVSGLSAGSNVLFNGLKVGEVTNLGFVKGNPSQVIADIDVTNASAPINANTKAQARNDGADRHGRRRADGRRGKGRGGAHRKSARHPVAADRDPRRPADQGGLCARPRQQAACRQRDQHPSDGRERAGLLDGARAQRRPASTRRWRASPTSARPSGRSPRRRRSSPRTPTR